jgi:Catalase/Catalase-related immune-responsive
MIMWLMSDRALPRGYRTMDGFGVHTFRFVNAEGKGTFVKFHWRPVLGAHSLVWDEVQKIAGADPDFNRRDLGSDRVGQRAPVRPGCAARARGARARSRLRPARCHQDHPRGGGAAEGATLFWNSMSDWEKQHIADAFQFELGKVERPHIRERVVVNLAHVDHALASQVAEALGLPAPPEAEHNHGRSSPALSQAEQPRDVATRKIAVFAADGVDAGSLRPVLESLREQGAICEVLAPHAGELEGGLPVDRPLRQGPRSCTTRYSWPEATAWRP